MNQSNTRNAIHVYALSESVIKIDKASFLTLLIDDIEKVKVPEKYIPKEYVYAFFYMHIPFVSLSGAIDFHLSHVGGINH